MNAISDYLSAEGISQTRFGKMIGVSQGMVWQIMNGLQPSEKLCVRIESATNSKVTRRMLRPNDWAEIWPELSKEPANV